MRVKKIPIAIIIVDREGRQRDRIDDLKSLMESIKQNGLIQPIVVQALPPIRDKSDYLLIAGERRLEACRLLGWKEISCRLMSDLSPRELKVIELEENVKRKNLSWKEKVAAISSIHLLSLEDNPDWLPADTAEIVAEGPHAVIIDLALQAEIDAGNTAIIEAATWTTARNTLERQKQRKTSTAMSKIKSAVMSSSKPREQGEGEQAKSAEELEEALASPPEPAEIIQGDFLSWAPAYEGEKFNMLHCDFPYGIGHDKSDQGGALQHGAYDDTPATYWKLCRCLAENLDNILLSSAHCIFWYSINNHQATIDFFTANTDFSIFPKPLIWHKTDNKGIVSDPSRYPRHVYETALFMTRGDRRIVQSVANVYGAPTQKFQHISEKSEAMLRHFFRMTCDEVTTMLDPTCGSGSAIRAAASFNVERALGIELDEEYAAQAAEALQQQRGLANLSKKLGENE